MNRALVLDSQKQPLMPCHPARARALLKKGKAAVYRRYPFTIILKERIGGEVQPLELKSDPGSRVTGLALVAECKRGPRIMWAANLKHRGLAVRLSLGKRSRARRRRRTTNLRYREPRYHNRARPSEWLPPSLRCRVDNVLSWAKRLMRFAPLSGIQVERVRFDTQKLVNPEISGIEYQQGELLGYEIKEYLLEKWGRNCVYCDAEGVPLQVEHIHPQSKGGSDRVSNLTVACESCNRAKDKRDVRDFLAHDPDRLAKILAQMKRPLSDAAAVNTTRYAIVRALETLGLPVSCWTGGRTKFNRIKQGYPKDHWIDAACVGESGANVRIDDIKPLTITATGRGSRQMCRMNKYGFPRARAKGVKRIRDFQTGDLVRLEKLSGRYAGIHIGRLAGVRANGQFDISVRLNGKRKNISVSWKRKRFTLVQRADGYAYGG